MAVLRAHVNDTALTPIAYLPSPLPLTFSTPWNIFLKVHICARGLLVYVCPAFSVESFQGVAYCFKSYECRPHPSHQQSLPTFNTISHNSIIQLSTPFSNYFVQGTYLFPDPFPAPALSLSNHNKHIQTFKHSTFNIMTLIYMSILYPFVCFHAFQFLSFLVRFLIWKIHVGMKHRRRRRRWSINLHKFSTFKKQTNDNCTLNCNENVIDLIYRHCITVLNIINFRRRMLHN